MILLIIIIYSEYTIKICTMTWNEIQYFFLFFLNIYNHIRRNIEMFPHFIQHLRGNCMQTEIRGKVKKRKLLPRDILVHINHCG